MLTHIYNAFRFSPIYSALEHIPARLSKPARPGRRIGSNISPRHPASFHSRAARRRNLRLRTLVGRFLAPLLSAGFRHDDRQRRTEPLWRAYDWPLGAAISVCILIITISCFSSASGSKSGVLQMSGQAPSRRAPFLTIYAALSSFIYLPVVVLILTPSIVTASAVSLPDLSLDWSALFADAPSGCRREHLIVAAGSVHSR